MAQQPPVTAMNNTRRAAGSAALFSAISTISTFLLAAALGLSSTPAVAVSPAQAAPAFRATLLGQVAQLDSRHYAGKVVYLDFWASWCAPCRQSFPVLESLWQRHRERGLVVLGVNQDDRPEDAHGFLAKVSPTFQLLQDPEHRLAALYGVNAMPSGILIDRKGVVRHVHRGFRRGDEALLAQQIEQVLAE